MTTHMHAESECQWAECRLERERDEARAALAPMTKERDEIQSNFANEQEVCGQTMIRCDELAAEAIAAEDELAAAQLEVVELRLMLFQWIEECECAPGDMSEYMHDKTRVALGSPTIAAPLIEALNLAHMTLRATYGVVEDGVAWDTRKAAAALAPWARK